jgi:DNA-binding protein Alba
VYAHQHTHAHENSEHQIFVKAQGRLISQAIGVVEVCRRLDIKEINIGTEVLGEERQSRNVSTIEIKLAKND